MSVGSVVVFTALSIVFLLVRGVPTRTLLDAPHPLGVQIALGALLGAPLAVAVVTLLLGARWLASFRRVAVAVLDEVRPTRGDMLLISINAGFAEELFFRGVLQPMIGLLAASFVFALLHTGLPRSRNVILFAVYAFAMGVLLGVVAGRSGLVAAMVAHAVYDFVFLLIADRRLRPAA